MLMFRVVSGLLGGGGRTWMVLAVELALVFFSAATAPAADTEPAPWPTAGMAAASEAKLIRQ
jgi:hypothetical protein